MGRSFFEALPATQVHTGTLAIGPARSVVSPDRGSGWSGSDLGVEIDPAVVHGGEVVHDGDHLGGVFDPGIEALGCPTGHGDGVRDLAGSGRPGRAAIEAIDRREILDGMPGEAGRLTHRVAERHDRRHRQVVGDPEGGAHLDLTPHHHGGHDPGQPLAARAARSKLQTKGYTEAPPTKV